MSSKLHSQIKVGDRVLCIASKSQLEAMGIVDKNLGDGLGLLERQTDEEWSVVKFDFPSDRFYVRNEYLRNVNCADSEEVEEAVINQIRSRRDAGRSKYGTTMERTDLSILQWVQHAQEEAMDFSIYLEKLKRVLKEKGIE